MADQDEPLLNTNSFTVNGDPEDYAEDDEDPEKPRATNRPKSITPVEQKRLSEQLEFFAHYQPASHSSALFPKTKTPKAKKKYAKRTAGAVFLTTFAIIMVVMVIVVFSFVVVVYFNGKIPTVGGEAVYITSTEAGTQLHVDDSDGATGLTLASKWGYFFIENKDKNLRVSSSLEPDALMVSAKGNFAAKGVIEATDQFQITQGESAEAIIAMERENDVFGLKVNDYRLLAAGFLEEPNNNVTFSKQSDSNDTDVPFIQTEVPFSILQGVSIYHYMDVNEADIAINGGSVTIDGNLMCSQSTTLFELCVNTSSQFLGGIEVKHTSTMGEVYVSENITVSGWTVSQGGLDLSGDLLCGNVNILGYALLTENMTIVGETLMESNMTVNAWSNLNGGTVTSVLSVVEEATIQGVFIAEGGAQIRQQLLIKGHTYAENATFADTVTINSNTVMAGYVEAHGGAYLSNLTVGDTIVQGTLEALSSVVADSIKCNNVMDVKGPAYFDGGIEATNMTTTGSSTFKNELTVKGVLTASGGLKATSATIGSGTLVTQNITSEGYSTFAHIYSPVAVFGSSKHNVGMTVNGKSNFNANVDIYAPLAVNDITVSDTTLMQGPVSMSSKATIAGNLEVKGPANMHTIAANSIQVSGSVTAQGNGGFSTVNVKDAVNTKTLNSQSATFESLIVSGTTNLNQGLWVKGQTHYDGGLTTTSLDILGQMASLNCAGMATFSGGVTVSRGTVTISADVDNSILTMGGINAAYGKIVGRELCIQDQCRSFWTATLTERDAVVTHEASLKPGEEVLLKVGQFDEHVSLTAYITPIDEEAEGVFEHSFLQGVAGKKSRGSTFGGEQVKQGTTWISVRRRDSFNSHAMAVSIEIKKLSD